MSSDKRALIAFHPTDIAAPFGDLMATYFDMGNYKVARATSVDEMLQQIDAQPDKRFEVYVMDTNLGFPGQATLEPAEKIYRQVASDVSSGNSRFYSMTSLPDLVASAQSVGIPAVFKDMPNIHAILRDVGLKK